MRDRQLQKTGITGAARDARGRFLRGVSGNPKGRPKGRVNHGTRAAAALLDGEAEALARKAVELALAGDAVALRLCLERVVGTRRGRPVALYQDLALPPLADARDLAGAIAAIAGAAAAGRLTPDEALALAQMMESFTRTLEAAHVERRRFWRGKIWQMTAGGPPPVSQGASPGGRLRRLVGRR